MALQGQPTFLTLTNQGQGSGNGTISKYDAATNTISAIHTFGSEGIYPVGNLCKVSSGKFYAMTNAGGTLGYGVIFSFDAVNSTYTVVHNFNNTHGAEPAGSLIKASNGKLYGITTRGGTSNLGVLFSFDPLTNTYTVLKNFDQNGYYPTGSLLQASDGKLYGMTWYGGSSNAGVIFSFDITNSVFTVVKNFANTDGAEPRGSLIQASDGKLYGMTSYGGIDYKLECYIDPITNIPICIITPGDGVIFSFDITTSSYNVLYNFNIVNGANPYGSLLQAADGKLYGMASRKNGGYGVVFSFDLSASNYVVLKNFDSYPDGAIPYGSLTQGSDSKLYGTLSEGGGSFRGYGVVFSLDAPTGNFIKQDFMGPNGARPFADLVEIATIQLICVIDTTTDAGEGLCSAIVSNIDPVITPAGSAVTYTLTGATTGNGTGTASGLQFNVGTTTVTYISTDDPSKTCSFTVTVNPTSVFYRDADTDGYGNAAETIDACTQPAGYVADNTDCNDNDASVHLAITYYRDADNDGFGDASSSSSLCQLTPPSGYVTNNSDCDDTQKLYQDSDGDGYGSTIFVACGGVTNNTDCDDNDAAIHAPVTYYRDADNDGYGNISTTTTLCSVTPPEGYVVNNTDCDDSNATTHPGATEICNNGIDDNCNGQADEGCPAGIPAISINDASVYESNGVAVLTVSLSNAGASDITIAYSTSDGTATSGPRGKKGGDYVAASGNIIVPAGSLSATIRITINTDNLVESAENFTVNLSLNKPNAKKATISDATGVVTILDGPGNRLSANNKDITGLNQKLTIRALPNPTATYFTLITQGNINQPISLNVYDISGRLIETKDNIPANHSISIGHSYKPGLYLAEIRQGDQKQTLKLVKGTQ